MNTGSLSQKALGSQPEKSIFRIFQQDAVSEKAAEGQELVPIDMIEREEEMLLIIPIAGITPDKIELSLNTDALIIRGERSLPAEIESKEGEMLVQECYWGKFYRTIPLPVLVDIENATAKLEQGIICITLPKSTPVTSKILDLQT